MNSVVDFIIPPLMHIINTSVDKEVLQSIGKFTEYNQSHKTNQPTNVTDFQSISILPIVSKIYERVIFKQLFSFTDRTQNYNDTGLVFR